MNLFAVLIGDGGIIRRTRIGSQYNAIFVNEAYDGGSRFGCEGQDGLVGVGDDRGVAEEGAHTNTTNKIRHPADALS